MSIQCEFIDLIIPIKNIDLVYSGGFKKFKKDHIAGFNGRLKHDDYLFRDGAMNPKDIKFLIEKWENMGLKGVEDINGKKQWKDFCVVEGMFGGPTLQCDWIEFDGERNCVSLKIS